MVFKRFGRTRLKVTFVVVVLLTVLPLPACTLFKPQKATSGPAPLTTALQIVTESPSTTQILGSPATVSTVTKTASPIVPTSTSSVTVTPASSTTPMPTDLSEFVPTAIVAIGQLNVRTGPGLIYPVLTMVGFGTVLRVIGKDITQIWLFVLLPDDQQGWVDINFMNYNFDLSILPVVQAPATPSINPTRDTYGGAILAPSDLSGITPVVVFNPLRGLLSPLSLILLILTIVGPRRAFFKRK